MAPTERSNIYSYCVVKNNTPPNTLPNTQVFVAGATGRLGARVVRELLSQGFSVRAGVRSADKAAEWKSLATQYGIITTEQARKLAIVEFDLTEPDSIAPALGNASRVC